jgi:fructosamine-3-kinase
MQERELAAALNERLGGNWTLRALGASSFCASWEARSASGRLFVKQASASRAALLDAEADGLRALAATHTVRVPALACSHDGVLAMEWLEFARPDPGFGARLGEALAALHAQPVREAGYGWTRDNFIGATPQVNRAHADWPEFFAQERLGAMLQRLDASRELARAVDAVIATLPTLFAQGDAPRPSLIHGDLWSGNWGTLADGTPVVYDPAVSCSDAAGS